MRPCWICGQTHTEAHHTKNSLTTHRKQPAVLCSVGVGLMDLLQQYRCVFTGHTQAILSCCARRDYVQEETRLQQARVWLLTL
jgi:hypothetical protein